MPAPIFRSTAQARSACTLRGSIFVTVCTRTGASVARACTARRAVDPSVLFVGPRGKREEMKSAVTEVSAVAEFAVAGRSSAREKYHGWIVIAARGSGRAE